MPDSTAALRPDPAALALVPGLEAGAAPLRLERLSGGSVNETWCVDSSAGRFVLRLDGAAWRRPGVDRAREYALHQAAARAGVAPRLIARSAAADAQVSEYVAGRDWSAADFTSPAQLERLGERLRQLHSVAVPDGVATFDPLACARSYAQLLAPARSAQTDVTAALAGVAAAVAAVAAGGGGACIIHGDLAQGNLRDGGQLWLLDWEYAQRAAPCFDAACVLAYYPAARREQARLLAAAGLPGQPPELAAAIYIYEALTWLWLLARGESSAAPRPFAP